MPRVLLLFISVWCCIYCNAQTGGAVPQWFTNILTMPVLHRFIYNGKLPPAGGHLQGIQGWKADKKDNWVLTGSSGNFAYCLVVHDSRASTLQQLDSFPFRHAGGCQLADHNLLVGVEDNITKNKSKVLMTALNDSGSAFKPIVLAQRKGTFKRSTAGATAACYTSTNELLIAVGDWDTRHIDFYKCIGTDCDSISTIQVPDSLHLPAYQAINLVKQNDKLYVVGFSRSGKYNRADLLVIQWNGDKPSALCLLSSKSLSIKFGACFRYGAGLSFTENGLTLYATQRKLKYHNCIAVYR